MKVVFDITRRKHARQEPFQQKIPFETDDPGETVATALQKINASGKVEPIAWEAGCLQKKCGACAMLINGRPALACDTFLRDLQKKSVITLQPLGKFPVIRDLICDRSILFENLKTLRVWRGENGEIREKNLDMAYEASRCLQCGCCLEVCPNFMPGGSFLSAAGYAPQARLITTYSEEERDNLRKLYQTHVYEGCGKALSCMKVCPAGIDLDRLLSRSNAVSVWRRK